MGSGKLFGRHLQAEQRLNLVQMNLRGGRTQLHIREKRDAARGRQFIQHIEVHGRQVHLRGVHDGAGDDAGFRDGSLPATVMNRIAKGFSEDELRAIAAWLAAQK